MQDGMFKMTLSDNRTHSMSDQRDTSPKEYFRFPQSTNANSSSSTLSSADSFLLWWNSSNSTSRSPSPYLQRNNNQRVRESLAVETTLFGKSLQPHSTRSRSLSPIIPRSYQKYINYEKNKKWLLPKTHNVSHSRRSDRFSKRLMHNNKDTGANEDGVMMSSVGDSSSPSSINTLTSDPTKHQPKLNYKVYHSNYRKIEKSDLERKKLYRSKSVSPESLNLQQTPIEVRSFDSLFKRRQSKMFSFSRFSNKSRKSSRLSSYSLNEEFNLCGYQVMLLLLYKLQNGRFAARAAFENEALKDAKKIIVEIIGYTLEVTFLNAEEISNYEQSKSKCVKMLLRNNSTPLKSLLSCSYHSANLRQRSCCYVDLKPRRYKMNLPIYADTNTLEFAWNKQLNFLEVSGCIKGCSNAFLILEEQADSGLAKDHEKLSRFGRIKSLIATRNSMQRRSSLLSSINCCVRNNQK